MVAEQGQLFVEQEKLYGNSKKKKTKGAGVMVVQQEQVSGSRRKMYRNWSNVDGSGAILWEQEQR